MRTIQDRPWQNWSGAVQSRPRQLAMPGSINELTQSIGMFARDGRRVRVVGAGHSFVPLVQTDDVLISLDNLQGIESIDAEQGVATVLGGTKLKRLGEELFAHRLAQENLGDINVQSIAGAISTGTHGTGIAALTVTAATAKREVDGIPTIQHDVAAAVARLRPPVPAADTAVGQNLGRELARSW